MISAASKQESDRIRQRRLGFERFVATTSVLRILLSMSSLCDFRENPASWDTARIRYENGANS